MELHSNFNVNKMFIYFYLTEILDTLLELNYYFMSNVLKFIYDTFSSFISLVYLFAGFVIVAVTDFYSFLTEISKYVFQAITFIVNRCVYIAISSSKLVEDVIVYTKLFKNSVSSALISHFWHIFNSVICIIQHIFWIGELIFLSIKFLLVEFPVLVVNMAVWLIKQCCLPCASFTRDMFNNSADNLNYFWFKLKSRLEDINFVESFIGIFILLLTLYFYRKILKFTQIFFDKIMPVISRFVLFFKRISRKFVSIIYIFLKALGVWLCPNGSVSENSTNCDDSHLPDSEVDGISLRDLKLKLLEEQDKVLCVVCQFERKNVMLLPCRHICVCVKCNISLNAGQNYCPICRQTIAKSWQVYI